jgi:hypothetical protein
MEPPAAPAPRREGGWKIRLRLGHRWPAVLAAIIAVLICATLLLTRGPVPDPEPDGEDISETDLSDGMAAMTLASGAAAEIGAPPLRLEIRTTGVCWVSAVADGERAVYRLMQAGERVHVAADRDIALRVGDAGAFAYSINDAAGRPLGRSGEAVTIHITIDNLESLYADPESDLSIS